MYQETNKKKGKMEMIKRSYMQAEMGLVLGRHGWVDLKDTIEAEVDNFNEVLARLRGLGVEIDKTMQAVLEVVHAWLVLQDVKNRENGALVDTMTNMVLAMDISGATSAFHLDIKAGVPALEAIMNMENALLAKGGEGVDAVNRDANVDLISSIVSAWVLAPRVKGASLYENSAYDEPFDDAFLYAMGDIYSRVMKDLRAKGQHKANTAENKGAFIISLFDSSLLKAMKTYEDEMMKALASDDEKMKIEAYERHLRKPTRRAIEDARKVVGWENDGSKADENIEYESIKGLRKYLREKVESDFESMQDLFEQEGANEGASAGASYARAFNEAFAGNVELGNMKPLSAMAFDLGGITADGTERKEFDDFVQSFNLPSLAEDLSNIDDVLEAVNQGLATLGQFGESVSETPQFAQMEDHLLGAQIALYGLNGGFGAIRGSLRETTAAFLQQDAQMRKFAENAPMLGEFKKGVEDLARAGKQQLTPELQALGEKLGITNTTVKGAQVNLQAYEGEMLATADSADTLGVELLLLASKAYIHGEITLDEQQAIEAAVAAGMSVEEFAAKCAEYGINLKESGGGGGRGGGGKSRKQRAAEEARKAAEEALRVQEAAWQKELDEQLKFLDRKKRLGEINTQEEIRQLEIIEAHYAKTTQQKIAMEEKLFEARARLRDEEIGQIDKLNQGVITAPSHAA